MKITKFFSEKQKIAAIVSLIAALLLGFYLSSGIILFQNPVDDLIPLNVFIIGFVLYVLFLGLLFFFNSFERNRIKFFLPLAVALGVIFAINIITTSIFKNTTEFTLISIDSQEYHGTYFVTNSEKFKYILQFFVMCMNVYLGLVVIPQMIKRQKTLKTFIYIYIGFVVLLTLISYITEYQKYYNFFFNFTPQSVDGSTISPLGLYKNTFGFLLTLQVFSFIYLHNDNRKWYFILMMFVALFNILIILCKLGLIISSLAIAIYLIYLLVDTWKNNPKRNMIIAIATGGTIVLVGGAVLILALTKNPVITEIFSKVSKLFETKENTFFTRTLIWKNCFTIVSTHNAYLFGCGYGVTGGLLYEYNTIDLSVYYNHTTHAHNVWIEYYSYGGIFLVIFSILLTAFLIYAIVKVWKKNKTIAFFSALLIFCSLIYGGFENYPIFFARSFESTLLGYMIIIPLMIEYYALDKEEIVEEKDNADIFNSILACLAPIMGSLLTVSVAHMIVYKTNLWLIAIAVLAVLVFVGSAILYVIMNKTTIKEFIKKRGLLYLILFVSGILLSIIFVFVFIGCDFLTFFVSLAFIALALTIALSINKTKELIFVK